MFFDPYSLHVWQAPYTQSPETDTAVIRLRSQVEETQLWHKTDMYDLFQKKKMREEHTHMSGNFYSLQIA